MAGGTTGSDTLTLMHGSGGGKQVGVGGGLGTVGGGGSGGSVGGGAGVGAGRWVPPGLALPLWLPLGAGWLPVAGSGVVG